MDKEPTPQEDRGYTAPNFETTDKIQRYLSGEPATPSESPREAIKRAREALDNAPDVDVRWRE